MWRRPARKATKALWNIIMEIQTVNGLELTTRRAQGRQ